MNTSGNNTAFGRVDADGTVYVRTAEGERAVGSWQAGSAEEGLAHFARRYDDLATEVELLETRLATGAADPQHTLTSVRRISDDLPTAHVVGDLDALTARLDTVAKSAEAKLSEHRAARAAAREQATTRKQELVAEAELIAAESTQWKAAGDRMRAILDEWKTIKGVDRKTDTELWKRYAAARDAFSRRRGSHFANLDAARKQAQTYKEELVTEAETLAESTDWQATANRLKQLMTTWKAAGRAPREAEEHLWKRFRAAQDHFFTRRSEVLSERDAEFTSNQKQKEALLAEAEAINLDGDLKAAQAILRDVQSRWEAIGKVPRESISSLDRRLRAVEDRVRDAADAAWRRTEAEANPLLDQMREQVAKAARQLEKAEASGDQRRIADARSALETKQNFLRLAERSH